MIERRPAGTEAIPYPHKVFHWKNGEPTLTIELDPRRRNTPPKLDGWTPFFVGFHGYDKPMHYSYKVARSEP